MPKRPISLTGALLLCGGIIGHAAGPYSLASGDADNPYDAPVPGFVGPDGEGKALTLGPSNYVNPLFFDWAAVVTEYSPFAGVSATWTDSSKVLGPVTGDNFDVASLGDMPLAEINAWLADPINEPGPGTITVTFTASVVDKTGADFVIFENGFLSGQLSADFAYVEVSDDGVNFVRFPSDADTPVPVGGFGTVDPTGINNLAGKHVNAYGNSWGTPFDLADVGLSAVSHIRLVDVPGNGSFLDTSGDPIHDGWFTVGSGGFDIEAFGVISRNMTYADWPPLAQLDPADRDPADDPDLDGISNLMEYACATLPWQADAEDATLRISMDETGTPVVRLSRDERLVDIEYILEFTGDPSDPQSWQELARSTPGGVLSPVVPFAPEVTEVPRSSVASVGVLREVSVRDPGSSASTFYRVRVEEVP